MYARARARKRITTHLLGKNVPGDRHGHGVAHVGDPSVRERGCQSHFGQALLEREAIIIIR